MKKLFINLLVALLISGLTPATPGNCVSLITSSKANKTRVSGANKTLQKPREFEIHPLDILAFKFL